METKVNQSFRPPHNNSIVRAWANVPDSSDPLMMLPEKNTATLWHKTISHNGSVVSLTWAHGNRAPLPSQYDVETFLYETFHLPMIIQSAKCG